MPITSARRATWKRALRPRLVLLVLVNVLTLLAFLAWRERYVTKESLLQMMDERFKAVFSPDREVSTDQVPSNFTGKAAFVSTICMESDFIPVRTLVHSLKQTGTNADIVIVVMTALNDEKRDQLGKLGASLVDTELIKVEIDESQTSDAEKQLQKEAADKGALEASNKRRICRNNSIQAWRLTQWDRVLYIHPEMLALENIDDVFQEPPFTATLELGGIVDDSIMLLDPNMDIYSELKKAMINSAHLPHDIGFLNYFFKDIHPLNPVYNVKAKYQTLDYSRYVFGNARVYNYEGTMKPWDFWYQGPKNWRQSFHEDMIYRWRQADYSAREKLGLDKDLLEWRPKRGSKDVCDEYLINKLDIPEKMMDKYSVLLATHSLRRQATLPFVIKQFLTSPKVDKIFVIWHDKDQPVSKNIRDLVSEAQGAVVILTQTVDSLNNRFNPVKELRTAAVLICDDDVWTPIDDIDMAFESWQRQPDSLVGFAPRVDCYDASSETIKYCWPFRMNPPRYSIMLTKLMFMDANFLFLWRCGLPDNILKYVDDLINCEDIAMNFLISGVTNRAPFHIMSEEVYDFGLDGGISSNPAHFKVRGQCVQQMTNLFGRNTLVSVQGSVHRYAETDFKSTNWEQFLDVLKEKEANSEQLEVVEFVTQEDIVQNDM
ncbi:glycosyl transferase family 64 domain-containing protein [Lipomyces orientalis]|uniref:Glycosyl transferase family 64 domain-containing protein n=1 Tax=Lipomyces orientalis TaxID=1233043 RepID=A0ACC3TX55_9ASCO